ncbi:MAG: hypothetical protein ACJAVI_004828 [Candidatus Azotimanducaceae bacterium]|jgi:hypothetical protein
MNFNICIVKPKNYPHSDAFWELAELIAFSLRDLNHNVIISINELISDRQNILFGGHLLTNNDFPNATIIFNTEQLRHGVNKWLDRIISLGQSHLIWDYSDDNIDFLKENNCSSVKKFQFGYHRKLSRISQREKDIDVLFYGTLKDRRKNLLIKLNEAGLKVKHLFGVYGAQRDEYISRAKIVLNCHHYDARIFEIVRVHYLINNSILVVSELDKKTVIDPFWKDIVHGVSYEKVTEECVKLNNNKTLRNKISETAFLKLKKRLQVDLISELFNDEELS